MKYSGYSSASMGPSALRRNRHVGAAAVAELDAGCDPVDALVIHMMPVVGELAPQVQAEHQAAREAERQPDDVDSA